MDFALLPPEVNSGRMYAGPGSGPMLAAAAAWDALSVELESAASGYSVVVSGLTGQQWSGPASAAMATAAAPYVAWLQTAAARAEQTATQAREAAAAYEAAFAMTVPPPVIAANRALLMALIATNFFGQNTPAIAVAEAHYTEMWAQDATAMYGYANASSSAGTLTPFDEPSQTTNPAGLSAQPGSVVHAAGTVTSTQAHDLSQLTSTLPSALQQLTSPLGVSSTTTTGSTSTSTTPSSVLSSVSSSLALPDIVGSLGSNVFNLGVDTYTETSVGWGFLESGGIAGNLNLQSLGPFDALSGFGGTTTSLGEAASLGRLSVPLAWAMGAADVEPVAIALSASVSAAPAVTTMSPGLAFQEALMGTMTGRSAISPVTDHKKNDNDRKDDKAAEDENLDESFRPIGTLLSTGSWLACSSAYNERRRAGA